jgi:hypothetical protein
MELQAILRLQFESPRVTMLLCQIYLLLPCDAAANHILSLAERANPGVAESCDLVLDCVSQIGDAMWLCPVSERGTEARRNQMARATERCTMWGCSSWPTAAAGRWAQCVQA